MSDCITLLVSDDPGVGYGFYGPCDEPLRNADNDMQYPCEGGAHYCGQLLSGCIWDLRNELAAKYPTTYLDTLANLTINSILLHTLLPITPQITIDFLTLDDDDTYLGNGTPNYDEICAAFGAHNMDCPELDPLVFEYPDGIPRFLLPDTQSTLRVNVIGLSDDPVPGTAGLYYSIDGALFEAGDVNELAPTEYEIAFPAIGCFQVIEWYMTCETGHSGTVSDPPNAPELPYCALGATHSLILFWDGFETDEGWSISGGQWERGTPQGGGGEMGYPDPSSAFGGENVFGYNLNGDYENDMPERHLTSPLIDCSNSADVHLSFWRWLGVQRGPWDHATVSVSVDGSDWTIVWENDTLYETKDYTWYHQEIDISHIADGEPSVYARFTMGETDGALKYCGWNIDDVEVSALQCDWMPDSDEDGIVNSEDNCPFNYNPDQEDQDGDTVGDSCDNCISVHNLGQEDCDSNGIGDACEMFLCGDGDGSESVDIDDAVFMVNYIFADGPAPCPIASGDADCSFSVDIDDVVYLISYIFSGGHAPCDTDGDGEPDC